MLSALLLSIRQLPDRRFLAVLAKSLAATILIFAAAAWGVKALLTGTNPCGLVSTIDCTIGGGAGGVAAIVALLVGLWLLFPAIAIGVMQVLADDVVEAVEAEHYPTDHAKARRPGWGEAILMGLKSGARLIGYNLLAAPFYLILLFTAIGPFLLFLAVNALVLGRDLAEMVAVRHVAKPGREAWLATTRGRRAVLGLAVSGLFMVPVLNLLAPILGAAMATHLHHRTRA